MNEGALVARVWHDNGMTRARISTTVDGEVLDDLRRLRSGVPDSALVDEALLMLYKALRGEEIDRQIREAYARHPLDEPDEWGSLAAWVEAAGKT